MADRYDKSNDYRVPPRSVLVWTGIALAIGLGTLFYWLI